MLLFEYYMHMFNILAQGNCTITAINPAKLTPAGKVFAIAYGTQNVMIQCNCSNVNGTVLDSIRWFDSEGLRVHHKLHHKYVSDTPHLMRTHDDKNVILVVPILNDSYDGIYTCGVGKIFPPEEPNIDIDLTFGKY